MAVSTQPKPKKSSAPKKAKSSPSHPPFAEMIADAIASLKERTGSSQYAITKFLEEKHKDLPPTFRKLLLHYLKKSVAAGKLVKVKNSFKLPPVRSAPTTKKPVDTKLEKATAKAEKKAPAKAKGTVKPKAAATKPKTGAKAAAKPAKTAKTAATKTSVGKKVLKAAKSVKKPKSVKSPMKKKAPAKKAKK